MSVALLDEASRPPYAQSSTYTALTVIYVAYGIETIDTAWLQPEDNVIVVHNDGLLRVESIAHTRTTHLISPRNVGFAAAVNSALDRVSTDRLILCNPDTRLTPAHRRALVDDDPDALVTVALNDDRGRPTWVVLPYPGALAVVVMGYRLGSKLGRHSRLRNMCSKLLTRSRLPYADLLDATSGEWPLSTHWVSGAVLSVPTERLRGVGGLDVGYFLYMEDVDLCRRLAARHPSMRVRLAGCEPAIHAVGGSSAGSPRWAIELERVRSLKRYCSRQRGLRWRMARAAVTPRALFLRVRA